MKNFTFKIAEENSIFLKKWSLTIIKKFFPLLSLVPSNFSFNFQLSIFNISEKFFLPLNNLNYQEQKNDNNLERNNSFSIKDNIDDMLPFQGRREKGVKRNFYSI